MYKVNGDKVKRILTRVLNNTSNIVIEQAMNDIGENTFLIS